MSMTEELELPWCFSDEHLAWQKTIQEFRQRIVAPGVIERDLAGQLDPDLIREVGRLGAFGLRHVALPASGLYPIAVMAIARSKPGKARTTSISRESTTSTHPPASAAVVPRPSNRAPAKAEVM